jgi:glycosyltransferase involved in cell wall biosynthesis
MRIAFFARLRDPSLLEVVDFYRNDIRSLRELGFEVVTATRLRDLPLDADLYFTWWWGSGILALLKSFPRGRPNVFTGTLQLSPELGWWEGLGPLKRGVVTVCVHLASANIGICDVEVGYLRQLGGRHIHLVHQGIDTEFYHPPAVRQPSKTVVTVSHLTRANARRKRLASVIRAVPAVLTHHSDARFVMIGGHEEAYHDLVTLAAALGVDHAVSFPGRLSTADKLKAYHGAAMLAQATIYEGFGVSIAEAMACGLPVVTSPRGAVVEVVGDCGRLVEPDDAEGMAREIVALLDDPAEGARLGACGRARVVERFSYPAHRAALARVLQAVLPDWIPPAGMA